MNTKKTFEEHLFYMHEIVKLKLFFLHHWLITHPEETFQDAIRNRVDIFRKTNGFRWPVEYNPPESSPEWLKLEPEAEKLFLQYRDNEPEFEKKAFELFRPSIDLRAPQDFKNWNNRFGEFDCGCLRCEEKIQPDFPDFLIFHITNAKEPESFLDDPEYFGRSLLKVCDKAEKIPGVTNVGTGTWMNSLPKFVNLFPPEWITNRSEEHKGVWWDLGFWGQFISARGTFNAKYAKILRETGELPYYHRVSFCSIRSIREKYSWIH